MLQNSKALREGPNVFMQLYGDPEVQLDVVAGGDDVDLDDAVDSDGDTTTAAPTAASQSRRGALPPQIAKKAAKPAAEVPHSVLQLDRFVSQLDAPSHSLPTTTAMFQQFADALVLRSTPTPSSDQGQSTPRVVTAATTRSVHYHQTERARLDDVALQHKEQELFSEAKLLERELASSRNGGNGSPYRFLHDFFSSGSQVQVWVTEQDHEREHEHDPPTPKQSKQQKVHNTTPNTKIKTPTTPKTTTNSNSSNSNVTPQHTATTTNGGAAVTTPKNNKSPKAPSSSTKKRKRSMGGKTDE
jgi:hypothetical protein